MTTVTAQSISSVDAKKTRVFSDELYQLLLNAQQTIFEKTDVKITLRKLLDKLITRSTIDEVTKQFIQQFTMSSEYGG